MHTLSRIALFIGVIVLLSGCSEMFVGAEGGLPDPPGFWMGLWHGFTMFFRFIIDLFTEKDLFIYYTPNNGGWYDFGYIFGASIFFGGSGRGAKRRKKC